MHSALDRFAPLVRPCHALDSMGISADGDVDLCYCAVSTVEDARLGSIYEHDLTTLAQRPKRIKAFKGFRDMHHAEDSVCKYCDAPYLF